MQTSLSSTVAAKAGSGSPIRPMSAPETWPQPPWLRRIDCLARAKGPAPAVSNQWRRHYATRHVGAGLGQRPPNRRFVDRAVHEANVVRAVVPNERCARRRGRLRRGDGRQGLVVDRDRFGGAHGRAAGAGQSRTSCPSRRRRRQSGRHPGEDGNPRTGEPVAPGRIGRRHSRRSSLRLARLSPWPSVGTVPLPRDNAEQQQHADDVGIHPRMDQQ